MTVDQRLLAAEQFSRALDTGVPAPGHERELEIVAALRAIPAPADPDDAARARMRSTILDRLSTRHAS